MSDIGASEGSGIPATAGASQQRPQSRELEDRPLPELVRQLSDQTSLLVRKEIELAQVELTAKVKRLGVGAGALGAVAVLALFALGALTACFILALNLVVVGWLAALLTAVFWLLVAGVLGAVGVLQLRRGTPPVPEQATDSVKEDVEWLKSRAKSARQ